MHFSLHLSKICSYIQAVANRNAEVYVTAGELEMLLRWCTNAVQSRFSLDFLLLYFGRAMALISDIGVVLLIERCLVCASSSLSQGQIVYHHSAVKVRLFIGWSDPSWPIRRPPGRKSSLIRWLAGRGTHRQWDHLMGQMGFSPPRLFMVGCEARSLECRDVHALSSATSADPSWSCVLALPVVTQVILC